MHLRLTRNLLKHSCNKLSYYVLFITCQQPMQNLRILEIFGDFFQFCEKFSKVCMDKKSSKNLVFITFQDNFTTRQNSKNFKETSSENQIFTHSINV